MELIQTSVRRARARFGKFPVKDFDIEGGSLTKQQYRDAVQKVMKEKGMTKNYQLMNRKTNKLSGRKFWTREEARIAKRNAGFKHAIVNLATGDVIR